MNSKLALGIVSLLLLSTVWYDYEFFSTTWVNTGEYSPCDQFVKEGGIRNLYQGQPYCKQGPVLYVLQYFIEMVFGSAFRTVLVSLFVIIGIHLYYLLRKSVKAKELLLMVLFFITFIAFARSLNALLATYAFFSGYYFLFTSTHKWSKIFAGIFFALALHVKINTLFALGLVILYYLFKHFENGKLRINLKDKFFISLLVSLIVLFFLWPNYYMYNLYALSQVNPGERGIFDAFAGLTDLIRNIHARSIFIISIFIGSLASLALARTFPAVIALIFSLIMYITDYRITGTAAVLHVHYYLPIFPFFIMALIALYEKTSRKQKIAYCIALAFLLSTAISTIQAEKDSHEVQKTLLDIYKDIPSQPGKILVQENSYHNERMKGFEDEKFEKLPDRKHYPVAHFDGWYEQGLVKLGYVNLSEWYVDTPQEIYDDYANKIRNGTYSLMLLGPPEWIKLTEVVQQAASKEMKTQYCQIILPDLTYISSNGRHDVQLFFADQNDCKTLLQRTNDYYQKNFNNICKKSPLVANDIVKPTLQREGITISETCTQTKDKLLYWDSQAFYVSPIIFLISLAILFYIYKRQ